MKTAQNPTGKLQLKTFFPYFLSFCSTGMRYFFVPGLYNTEVKKKKKSISFLINALNLCLKISYMFFFPSDIPA